MEPSTWDVLIIDNEPDNIDVARHILTFNGATVTTAISGAAGLALLREKLPTFLLLDIQMPEMSGWQVLDVIRADEALQKLTVIALSAHVMLNIDEQLLSVGFDGYLSKPISAFTLIDDIATILRKVALKLSDKRIIK